MALGAGGGGGGETILYIGPKPRWLFNVSVTLDIRVVCFSRRQPNKHIVGSLNCGLKVSTTSFIQQCQIIYLILKLSCGLSPRYIVLYFSPNKITSGAHYVTYKVKDKSPVPIFRNRRLHVVRTW